MEINALKSLVYVFLLEDGEARLVWSTNHIPVKMKYVESAIVSEGLSVAGDKGIGKKVHV